MIQELLPKWYKPVTLSNLSEETFRKRITDIKKIAKTKSIEWLCDCLRFYLQKPLANDLVITDLKTAFGKSDSFFHQNDSSLELQILCGAIIYEAVFTGQDENYELALLTSAAVFMLPENIMNKDIIE